MASPARKYRGRISSRGSYKNKTWNLLLFSFPLDRAGSWTTRDLFHTYGNGRRCRCEPDSCVPRGGYRQQPFVWGKGRSSLGGKGGRSDRGESRPSRCRSSCQRSTTALQTMPLFPLLVWGKGRPLRSRREPAVPVPIGSPSKQRAMNRLEEKAFALDAWSEQDDKAREKLLKKRSQYFARAAKVLRASGTSSSATSPAATVLPTHQPRDPQDCKGGGPAPAVGDGLSHISQRNAAGGAGRTFYRRRQCATWRRPRAVSGRDTASPNRWRRRRGRQQFLRVGPPMS